jgi:hypothetical protein
MKFQLGELPKKACILSPAGALFSMLIPSQLSAFVPSGLYNNWRMLLGNS